MLVMNRSIGEKSKSSPSNGSSGPNGKMGGSLVRIVLHSSEDWITTVFLPIATR